MSADDQARGVRAVARITLDPTLAKIGAEILADSASEALALSPPDGTRLYSVLAAGASMPARLDTRTPSREVELGIEFDPQSGVRATVGGFAGADDPDAKPRPLIRLDFRGPTLVREVLARTLGRTGPWREVEIEARAEMTALGDAIGAELEAGVGVNRLVVESRTLPGDGVRLALEPLSSAESGAIREVIEARFPSTRLEARGGASGNGAGERLILKADA